MWTFTFKLKNCLYWIHFPKINFFSSKSIRKIFNEIQFVRYSLFVQQLIGISMAISGSINLKRECVYCICIVYTDTLDGPFWIFSWWFTSSFVLLFVEPDKLIVVSQTLPTLFVCSYHHHHLSHSTNSWFSVTNMYGVFVHTVYLNVTNEYNFAFDCMSCVAFVGSMLCSFRCECEKFIPHVWLFRYFFSHSFYFFHMSNIFILSLVGIWFGDSNGRGGKNDDDDMHFGIWSNCRTSTHSYT